MKRFENIGRLLMDTPGQEGGGAAPDNTLAGGDPFADVPEIGEKPVTPTAPAPNAGGEGGEGGEGGGDPPAGGEGDYKVPSMWNYLSDSLSTEENPYALPDPIKTGKIDGKELSEAESFNLLVKEIQSHTRVPELEDAFIKDYVLSQRKYGEEFDKTKFISKYSGEIENKNKSDFDFHFDLMKRENGKSEENPEGWTDEEIKEDLASRSRIALTRERKALEADMQKELQSKIALQEKELAERNRNEIISRQKEDDARLLEVESHFMENLNINGIQIGESEMKEAFNEFRALNTYDENGNKPLYNYLSDDKLLFQAYFLSRGNGSRLKEILATVKSDAAKSILERTSLHPSAPNAQAGGVGSDIPTADDIV